MQSDWITLLYLNFCRRFTFFCRQFNITINILLNKQNTITLKRLQQEWPQEIFALNKNLTLFCQIYYCKSNGWIFVCSNQKYYYTFKKSTYLTFKISQFWIENLLGLFGVVQLGLQLSDPLISQLDHVNHVGIAQIGHGVLVLTRRRQHAINVKPLTSKRNRLLVAAYSSTIKIKK